MNTISSTVGMGNIAGVAIALCVGGPGAIFWMWVSALLGMATKFFEGTLAIMYKGKDDKGVIQGGPMFVLTEGLGRKMKPLAVMFAFCALFSGLPVMQANQLSESLYSVILEPLGVPESRLVFLVLGLVIGGIVSLVIFGGIKRISQVSSRIVPFMVGFYFLMVLGIMIVYSYYGTMCTSYLWGTRHAQKYRYFYVATIVLASVLTLDVAVSVMDLAFALMAFPNMIAVFALAPKVMKEARRFFTMNRQGSC